MSTFNGIVREFPDIRIDFFRRRPDVLPPLACFLSHVHSDHLAGLDSLRSPFVYCSAATREILLRLERYPCRINYAKGILEARQQTYKHLSKVLKPLPLETPTCIQLQPEREIQVTLFDANHCPGAVMFLIEDDGVAVLYTGDIRSEPWFVNNFARNPCMIQYTSGLKRLQKVYLDTSFTEDIPFQTKAEGLAELLKEVSRYPKDTIFHFQAWTYGYEEVWVALAKYLKSQIHVDDYKMRIYNSLRTQSGSSRQSADLYLTQEAPALTGFMCGNSPQPGYLTSDTSVRLHSCEKGNTCTVACGLNVVSIQPIIAHLKDGGDLKEMGIGGGGDDLQRDVELDFLSPNDLRALLEIIAEELPDSDIDDFQHMLANPTTSGRHVPLNLDLSVFGDDLAADLRQAIHSLIRKPEKGTVDLGNDSTKSLPKVIYFPYSRHSSYGELCHLLDVLKPLDVWPCTVDVDYWLKNEMSIQSLFGRHCSGSVFQHDVLMAAIAQERAPIEEEESQAIETQGRMSSQVDVPSSPPSIPPFDHGQTLKAREPLPESGHDEIRVSIEQPKPTSNTDSSSQSLPKKLIAVCDDEQLWSSSNVYPQTPQKRTYDAFREGQQYNLEPVDQGDSQMSNKSIVSTVSVRHSIARQEAYQRMMNNVLGGEWMSVGLLSTGGHAEPARGL